MCNLQTTVVKESFHKKSCTNKDTKGYRYRIHVETGKCCVDFSCCLVFRDENEITLAFYPDVPTYLSKFHKIIKVSV